MKKIYFWLADRFNALQSRERLLVFIGLTVLLCGLFYIIATSSLLARQQAPSRQVTQSGQTLSVILQQEAQLQNLAGQNPDAEAEQTARNLQLQNNELRSQLQAAHMQLANPDNTDYFPIVERRQKYQRTWNMK